MNGPYREAAAKLPAAAPERLECWLRDGDKNRWVRAVYVKLWLAVVAAVWVVGLGAALAAPPILMLGLLWASRDWLARRGAAVTFSVEGDRVRIEGKELASTFVLQELHDVRLDTKSTSKNLTVARADGVNTVFGAASNHNIDLDVSRIELTFANDEPLLLGREWLNHSLCTESLRTIRLFLRAHGWKPADERVKAEPLP